jgi:hypothetical protein
MRDKHIKQTRPMTTPELEDLGWEHERQFICPMVIELEDGSILIPARDAELNGPGHLLLKDTDGNYYSV